MSRRQFRVNDEILKSNDGILSRTVPIVFAVLCVLVFLLRARAGLHLFEFGDETEKFVAARMMQDGLRLYRDIFAHHGPILYIIAHAYISLMAPADLLDTRWFMVGLALFSSAFIYFSPIFRNTVGRLAATGLFLAVLSSVWVLQGMHMLLYHQVGGLLFIIPATQLFLPLFFGRKPTIPGLAWSGFSMVVVCFSAYAFGPSIVLVTLASFILLKRESGTAAALKHLLPLVWGALLAVLLIASWFLLYADLEGFFIYHFYFNQEIYSRFINFNLGKWLNQFQVSLVPAARVHACVLFLLVMSISIALVAGKPGRAQSGGKSAIFPGVLFLLSLMLLNPRGALGFHDAGFEVAGLAVSSILIGYCVGEANARFFSRNNLLLILVVFLFIGVVEDTSRKATSAPWGVMKPDFKAFSDARALLEDYGLVSELAADKGDTLSLIFNPALYIKTGKLPASGNYYYLPWQAAYNKNPVHGYKIDICADLALRRPSVIWFDNWKVWERYSVSDYEPCILQIMDSSYSRISDDSHLFIRSDRLLRSGAAPYGAEVFAAPALAEQSPIVLGSLSSHDVGGRRLSRIGIKFKTDPGHRSGKAELVLLAGDGRTYRQEFSLSDLQGDHYQYFDVPVDAGRGQVSGEIRSVSGGGISVWKIRSADGDVSACINYIYSDRTLALSPGCPQK